MTDARSTPSRRALRAATFGTALLCALHAVPRAAGAQLPAKKTLAGESQSACPRFPRPVAPAREQAAESHRLAQQGYEAALVGDHPEARDLLRRAAQLDLTSEEVAYRLGREHEEVGAASDAILEYCRYLSLAPQAGNSADVRERIARLSPQQSLTATDVSAVQFAAGVGHLEGGRLPEAQTAFTAVLADNPQAAPAHYNLGVVHAAMGQPKLAIRDLKQYLALDRAAKDRPAVERELVRLDRWLLEPGTALGWGLLAPGGGQMYTRRGVIGAAVAATALGSLIYAIQPKDETVTHTGILQPSGEPYTYTTVERSYPNMALGVGVAAAAWLAGATEAHLYARRGRAGMPRPGATQRVGGEVRPFVAPADGGGALLGARLRFR
jgi:tetratricopeptide (TPR) repeat protein